MRARTFTVPGTLLELQDQPDAVAAVRGLELAQIRWFYLTPGSALFFVPAECAPPVTAALDKIRKHRRLHPLVPRR